MSVLTVEVASRLLVVRKIEDLVEPLQELSFSCVRSTVDEHAVRLIFWTHEQVLNDVLDESRVVGSFHFFDNLRLRFR